MTSPSNKTDHNEVNAIQNLLQCSRSSAYRQKRKASAKRGHLIAQVKKKISEMVYQTMHC